MPTKSNPKKGSLDNSKSGITLQNITPKNPRQKLAFDAFRGGQNLILHGYPGTGKTFIALYLALEELSRNNLIEQVVICRSVVPTRDMGFLKGNEKEKAQVYEAPYEPLLAEMYNRGDAYGILKAKKTVKFITTSFIRGITFDRSIIILDEAQNMSEMELHSMITRTGIGSRLIISGDLGQDDLTSERYFTETGLAQIMNIMSMIPSTTPIHFEPEDILRSDFVKDYIMAKIEYEKSTNIVPIRVNE